VESAHVILATLAKQFGDVFVWLLIDAARIFRRASAWS